MRKRNTSQRLEQQKQVRSVEEASGGQEEDPVPKPRRGGRIKGGGKAAYRKDMYKVLDGSALMAIGECSDYYYHCRVTYYFG